MVVAKTERFSIGSGGPFNPVRWYAALFIFAGFGHVGLPRPSHRISLPKGYNLAPPGLHESVKPKNVAC